MNPNIIPALIVASVSALLIAAVVYLLVVALLPNKFSFRSMRGFRHRMRLRQKENLLRQVDHYLTSSQYERAYPLLHNAFLLDSSTPYPEIVDQIHYHHLAVLERLISIADSHAQHLTLLPVIEDLLISRAQLEKARIDTKNSKRLLAERIRSKQRETPEWALAEYNKKLEDIAERLNTNRQSLISKLDELFLNLKKLSTPELSVTFH